MCYSIDSPYTEESQENFVPFCPYYQYLFREFHRPTYYPPGRPQGGPPSGAPGMPPGGQHGMPPGGGHPGGPQGGPPTSPPPSAAPVKSQAQIKAVSPGALRPCTFRYVYLWLTNGRSFWAWLTYVDRRSAAGWRWNGRIWVYFGIDLRSIESFVCY